MNLRACKDCVYFSKYYGTKDKQGNATVSNYWCAKHQGFIKHFPKECKLRRQRNER